MSPDLLTGFWPDKSDWLLALDSAGACMTNAPFLLNTTPGSLILLADQVYARCKMTRMKTATAGDQASFQALLQRPKGPIQTVHPTAEVLQYEGPPKDMLRGPFGPAPINMPPRARRNAKPAIHPGPNDLQLWKRDIAMTASMPPPLFHC